MVILNEFAQESSPTSGYVYDVFLSFRGIDTRRSFTDHLHKALVDADINTFLDDDEIQTGEALKPELESAIKASRASIIVLSQNYASSTWCLDELVLILERRRTSDHIVIPIFYQVEPTNVRKQQSSFGDAMAKYKQRMEAETDAEKRSHWAQKIVLWKKALTEVADLKGKDVNNRREVEFIEEIVMDIHQRIGVPLMSTLPLLIGMQRSIEFITTWLNDGSSHTADILTILGMGGIGKTSLAKYVYGLHNRVFDRSSFIEDIGRRCTEQFNGLLDLQKQLFGNISKTSLIQVHDVFVYTSKIENALARKKVLLVLDGVDNLEQLYALLGNKGFHPGSKIIITAKDASLSKRYALFNQIVQPKHTKHLLQGLYETESLKLLSFHAFMCNDPKEGYEEVSKKLVKYCEGHPLALEVLGKSLRNRDIYEWEDCIDGLKKETDSCIKKVLQMSFESLPSKNDKELFKHIACFFVGKDRKSTEMILNACGIRTVLGISNLIDRCLLRIVWGDKLRMHQLLQEMGRDVVRQESLDKPWKRSRLWSHEESFKVLKQKKGKENLLGLALDMRKFEKGKLRGSFELKTDALSKMDNLMLLQLNYVQLNGSYENFPQELRWLCLHGFPLEYIPSNLPMENVVVLDMSYSNIKSFGMSYNNPLRRGKMQKLVGSCSKDNRLLGSLKILNLSFCYQLRSVGGFFELPALERLILSNCTSLIELCKSIEQCDELVLIDLSYCSGVNKLLRSIDKLKVKTLSLKCCNLGEFPQTSSFAIVEVIPRALKSFEISLPCSLVSLSLRDNNLSNESFPTDFSSLSMLKKLYLDHNPIVSMPNCVRSLPRLEKLSMDDCDMLETIEYPPLTLKYLIFNYHLQQKVVFDTKMSLVVMALGVNFPFPRSLIEIEGIVKAQPIADVEEQVLRSLGWTNLEFIRNQVVQVHKRRRGHLQCRVQMYYEFGIFSTIYGGKEVPNWISHRSKGSSISFTIPSSPNNLRGLNFCYVMAKRDSDENFRLPFIIISNVTKKHTWIYHHYVPCVRVDEECLIFLSHWMFGKNEMEDGDQVTITINNKKYHDDITIKECRMSLVYDDGNMEEDPLGYYKSWNHIIGGNLFAFRLKTGEYDLRNKRFFPVHVKHRILVHHSSSSLMLYFLSIFSSQDRASFRALSKRKSSLHLKPLHSSHERKPIPKRFSSKFLVPGHNQTKGVTTVWWKLGNGNIT